MEVTNLRRRSSFGLIGLVLASACSGETEIPAPPSAPPPCASTNCIAQKPGEFASLSFSTYDGSGEVVHPDIAVDRRTATTFWLAITPYPAGNSSFENPSIFESGDGLAWAIPTGLSNPLVVPSTGAYLSDPDITIDPETHQFRLYYRTVAQGQNMVNVVRSLDGVHWGAPRQVLNAPGHEIISPAVVTRAPTAPWQMWSVNAGSVGCGAISTKVERRISTDGFEWLPAQTVELKQPGQTIWHIEVQWIPERKEYWALYNTYPANTSCTTDAIYLARSPDGMHWATYPSPVLRSGVIDEFHDIVYRSTFLYSAESATVAFWFSGATYVAQVGYSWHAAAVTRSVDELLAAVARPYETDVRKNETLRRMLPPPEPDIGRGDR